MASCYFVGGDTPLREGGGEPSLEYYEDLYGSLRMPLSIWVILRIYNEDAMPAPPLPSWPLQQVKSSLSLSLSLSLDFSSSRGPDRGQSVGPACGFVLVITPARHPGRGISDLAKTMPIMRG